MIKAAADPVAALATALGIMFPPYGAFAGVGIQALKAIIVIINNCHGDQGVLISFNTNGIIQPLL